MKIAAIIVYWGCARLLGRIKEIQRAFLLFLLWSGVHAASISLLAVIPSAHLGSNLKSWSPAFAAHSSLAIVQCMTISSVFLCSCSAPYVWYAWAFCQVMSLREVCVQFSKAVSMGRLIRGCNTLSYRNHFFPSPMVVGVRSFLDFSCWSFLDFSWPLSSLSPTVIGEVDNVAMSASGASRSSRFIHKSCSTHSCLASMIWHKMSWM